MFPQECRRQMSVKRRREGEDCQRKLLLARERFLKSQVTLIIIIFIVIAIIIFIIISFPHQTSPFPRSIFGSF